MSEDQIVRQAIQQNHEIIVEVAEQHQWNLAEVHDTQFFFEAVKDKIFHRTAHLVTCQSRFTH